MRCKYCGNVFDEDDFTSIEEACEDICPECLYSGNMVEVEDELYDDLEEDGPFEDAFVPTRSLGGFDPFQEHPVLGKYSKEEEDRANQMISDLVQRIEVVNKKHGY